MNQARPSINSQPHPEAGSAIIYVFLGIILFVALALTFGKSQQDSGKIAISGEARLAATQITSYADKINKAVAKLIAKGCSESEISFENQYVAGYTNASAPVNKSCHVFDVAGGNIRWQLPPTIVPSYEGQYIFGTTAAYNLGQTGTTAGLDIAVWLRNLPPDVCKAINDYAGGQLHASRPVDSYGIPAEDNAPNFGVGVAADPAKYFNGTFSFARFYGDTESFTNAIFHRCIKKFNAEEYIYIGILLPR